MARATEAGCGRHGNGWRRAAWAAVLAVVVLTPLIAMQFTDEVAWTAADFVFAGVLVAVVAVTYELALRMTGDTSYRAGVAIALAGAFMLVWLNGAVGVIGSEDNDANLMYGGVLAIGIAGSIIARLRPAGLPAWCGRSSRRRSPRRRSPRSR